MRVKSGMAALLFAAACASTPQTQVVDQTEPTPGVWLMIAGEEIASVLAAQQAAWNAGDIDGFMEGYWRSPDLRFASGDKITRGWEETLARYKARYSSKALMGELSFDILQTLVFDDENAMVFGRWKLTRPEKGDAQGLFTLVLRRIDGEWRIISDHTS